MGRRMLGMSSEKGETMMTLVLRRMLVAASILTMTVAPLAQAAEPTAPTDPKTADPMVAGRDSKVGSIEAKVSAADLAARQAVMPVRPSTSQPLVLARPDRGMGTATKLGLMAMIIGAGILMARYRLGRNGGLRLPQLSVRGRTALGAGRAELVVVEVDGRQLLLGVTPDSVSYITQVRDSVRVMDGLKSGQVVTPTGTMFNQATDDIALTAFGEGGRGMSMAGARAADEVSGADDFQGSLRAATEQMLSRVQTYSAQGGLQGQSASVRRDRTSDVPPVRTGARSPLTGTALDPVRGRHAARVAASARTASGLEEQAATLLRAKAQRGRAVAEEDEWV
jgi:flagellar biogenesis protein FliO